MSFGLQVLSPSGLLQLDTTMGNLLLTDIIEPVPDANWNMIPVTRQYPALNGHTVEYAVVPTASFIGYGIIDQQPQVTISNVGGIPEVTVQPHTTQQGSMYAGGAAVYIFAKVIGSSPLDSFGLQISNAVDNSQLVYEGTKLLRYKGSPSHNDSYAYPYNPYYVYYYYLSGYQGSPVTVPWDAPRPIVFFEVSPNYYSAMEAPRWYDYSANGGFKGWMVATYTPNPGFIPKIFVFTQDVASVPISDNSHGMAIYGPSGAEIFHSGRDVRLMQIADLSTLIVPPVYGTAETLKTLPAGIACNFNHSVYWQSGPGYGYITYLKRTAGGVEVKWLATAIMSSYWYTGTTSTDRVAFIDTSLYV